MISKIFLFCQFFIKQITELKIIQINPPILEILLLYVNRVRIDCAISGSKEYLLLIIWAKNGNFFQKCTEKPLRAWTIRNNGDERRGLNHSEHQQPIVDINKGLKTQ